MKYLTDYLHQTPVEVATTFYKCASVNTSAKTWTGYELILEDGVYTISTTLTSGLTYTAITPVVGTVYTEDALIKVSEYADGMPTDGLVLFVPLEEDILLVKTGQSATLNGTLYVDTISGVRCNKFGNGSYVAIDGTENFASGDSPRTFSCWIYAEDVTTRQTIFSYGDNYENEGWQIEIRNTHVAVTGVLNAANEGDSTGSIQSNKWHHIAVIHNNSTSYFYIDGILSGEFPYSRSTSVGDNPSYIGVGVDILRPLLTGTRITALRLYNIALSQDEIAALANEF